MSLRLEEFGLDPEYWSDVLKAGLSLHQVGELCKEDIGRLVVRFKRSESELKALNRFIATLGIRNIGFVDLQMDNSKRKHDRAKLLFNQLFELNEATDRLRSDSDKKKKADELCKALDVPRDNWLKDFNQEAVATVIVSLSRDLPKLDEFLSTKSDLSIAQALDEASDGLALRGLLPTEESGYQRCPEKLLSASCRPRISIPPNCQETIEVVHSSKKNFQDFNRTLKISGFNMAAKMKAGNSGGGSAADQEGGNFDEGTVEDVHYSKTMCLFLSSMKVDLRETESCSLSTRALEELKGMAKLVADGTDEQLKSKCIEFLKRFGSHFHLDYILGGIFKLAVVYSNSYVVGLRHRAIVDMVNGIYDAVLSSSFLGLLCPHSIEGFLNEEKMKKLGLGNIFDPSVLSKVSIQVERYGGSGDIKSIPLWKASLGLGSDICSVVECDPPQLCAIWDLIYKINTKEIQHPQKIANLLYCTERGLGSVKKESSLTPSSPGIGDPGEASLSSPEAGSPITRALESDKKEPVVSPTSNQLSSGIPGEASLSSPEAGSPLTRALESDQAEPVVSPTSNPLSSGIPGEASLSSPEAGSPITRALESNQKETVVSPTSNPLSSGNHGEAPSLVAGSQLAQPLESGKTETASKTMLKPHVEQCPSSQADPHIAYPDDKKACRELLCQLCLDKYYPERITLKDVVSIKQGQEDKETLAVCDIPWVILSKILMNNYKGRNTAWEGKISVSNSTNQGGLADLDDDPQGSAIPHPSDIFLATFCCCDLMLRQVLLEKMTKCRLSVPLVMPVLMGTDPTLCKWALRSVVLEYSRHDGPRTGDKTNSLGTMVESALVDCPMKVVSFVRIGEIPISKSQLLNGVLNLNAQSHHTFFNKESCSLRTFDRAISIGMIEAAWYIPSKRDEGFFDDVTMFLNLRGDASRFPDQSRLISTISSVVIVFVDINDLAGDSSVAAMRTLYQRNQRFVLVLTGTTTDAKGCVRRYGEKVGEEIMSATTNTIITTSKGKQQKTLIEIGHGIRQNLSRLLKERNAKTYEELSQMVSELGIRIDEDDEECQHGKELAGNVSLHMKDIPIAAIKEEQLPIQKLWPEWSKLLKEQNRTTGGRSDTKTSCLQETERLHREMQRVRKSQSERCNVLSPVLNTFSTTLTELIDKPATLHFYLQWLKFFFDQLSREHLPSLRQEYNRCWTAFNAAKSQTGNDQSRVDLTRLKEDLQKAENELAEASCGLEHLFREVGQLYEASKESKVSVSSKIKQLVDRLPEVAAKLILLGHPIELMDGDAANVPLTWVKEVLTSLASFTGDKRVFVLSVLGIQSSGKSTLLNTMFGLQFAVSAGRCTRGVYAQLVEVDKSKTGLPFDYILVVDTEGLRAPELSQDKHEHDNELATLAIGLGDVVILNIKGENVAEMKDVLQIAVHAFLRMKRVELHQTCVFIHQNVSAQNANEKMLHGQQNLLDNLNEMAEQAAEQEELRDIHSFNQIIDLNVQKCVWYFSDLWQGDPPMAPTNPGYSESVDNMRKCLLFDIVMNQKNKFLSVSHLTNRINDLWQGILADNFVFSFRNTLAVKAYSGLEDKYHEVTWVIERDIMEWFSDAAQNKLERCETETDLENASVQLINDLNTRIGNLKAEQKAVLEKFFEQNTLKDITIQWKEAKVKSLLSLADELQTKTKMNIIHKKDRLGFELRNRTTQEDLDKKIMVKASELADGMKGKSLTDEMLYSKFSEMWDKWLILLAPPTELDETPILIQVENILFTKLMTQYQHVRDEVQLLASPLLGPLSGNFTVANDDINQIKTFRSQVRAIFMSENFEKYQKRALDLTESVFKKTEAILSRLLSMGVTFQSYHATEVVKTVIDFVDTHNREHSGQLKFTFLAKYKVRLAVHVCRRAIPIFTKMRDEYNKKHSPTAKLEIMKKRTFNLFKNKVRNCTNELTAAEYFCDHLAELIKEKISGNMTWKIFEDIYHEYSQKKYHLIVAILEYLADRDEFDIEWLLFLFDTKNFALDWITKEINKRCFGLNNRAKKGSYASIAGSMLDAIIKGIHDSVEAASEHVRQHPPPEISHIREWLRRFCDEAEKYLAVREGDIELVAKEGVEDIDNFEKYVTKQLDEKKEHILKCFREKTEEVEWGDKTPYQLVMEKLWGCGAQCPFCREPCQWTDAGHFEDANSSHQCIQHRCKGLGGWSYESGIDQGRLCIESCSYSIQSKNMQFQCQKQLPSCKGSGEYHDYIAYKTYYPDWDIAPSATMESSKFWRWVMATYKKELAELFDSKEANIPQSWKEITKEEALKSLRESR